MTRSPPQRSPGELQYNRAQQYLYTLKPLRQRNCVQMDDQLSMYGQESEQRHARNIHVDFTFNIRRRTARPAPQTCSRHQKMRKG